MPIYVIALSGNFACISRLYRKVISTNVHGLIPHDLDAMISLFQVSRLPGWGKSIKTIILIDDETIKLLVESGAWFKYLLKNRLLLLDSSHYNYDLIMFQVLESLWLAKQYPILWQNDWDLMIILAPHMKDLRISKNNKLHKFLPFYIQIDGKLCMIVTLRLINWKERLVPSS